MLTVFFNSQKNRPARGYCPVSVGPPKWADVCHGEKYNRTILTWRFSDRQIIHNRLVYLLVNWEPKQRLQSEFFLDVFLLLEKEYITLLPQKYHMWRILVKYDNWQGKTHSPPCLIQNKSVPLLYITLKTMANYIRFDWAMTRLLRDKANFSVLEGLLTT